MKPSEAITLRPIGVVRNGVKEPTFGGWMEMVSRLEVADEYREG